MILYDSKWWLILSKTKMQSKATAILILEKDPDITMDWIYQQRRSYRENINKHKNERDNWNVELIQPGLFKTKKDRWSMYILSS